MPFSHIKIHLVIIMCVKTCCWLRVGVGGGSSNHMQVLQYGQVAEPEASGDPTSPLYSQALAHNELIMHPSEQTLPFQCTHFDKLRLTPCFYTHKRMRRSDKQCIHHNQCKIQRAAQRAIGAHAVKSTNTQAKHFA